MKPYPNEELERMSKREIIRLYKRTVEQFNDAVPVIRCRDCKFYSDDYRGANPEWHLCTRTKAYRTTDDYCSRAERAKE